MFSGIDLGGTKVEVSLFNRDMELVQSRRVKTPKTYGDLVDVLEAQYDWLCDVAGDKSVKLGIGIPGVIGPTGISETANLPATGKPLHADFSDRVGFSVPVENDCKCFALSEANGGAGDGYETVFGLILGTGCGGGVCFQGSLVKGHNGLPGEVGHFGVPLALANALNLPCLPCGCGRTGCYETLISGVGIAALSEHFHGQNQRPEQIVAAAQNGDRNMEQVLSTWTKIVCELVHTIQLTVDPDCIVLGGGLSRIEGIAGRIQTRYAAHRLEGITGPEIIQAKFGDSSGVRGAALLAVVAD